MEHGTQNKNCGTENSQNGTWNSELIPRNVELEIIILFQN